MENKVGKVVYWTLRILAIIFIAFLDVVKLEKSLPFILISIAVV